MQSVRRTFRGCAVIASAALAVACSASAGDDSGSSHAGVSASPPLSAGPGSARDTMPRTECGEPPYVDLVLWMFELGDEGPAPLVGAKLTFNACPNFSATSDALGLLTAKVSRGVPLVPRFEAPGHVPVMISEVVLDADSVASDFTPSFAHTNVIPDYSADRPVLSVYLAAQGTGACAIESGVSLRVVDHPEARAIYMQPTWPRDATPSAGAASSGNVVFFTGLAAGEPVTIEGTKPGCRVHVTESEQTGRFALENGTWTVGNVFIDDL